MTDHDHSHDHDHDRTVKPMVDEITDFEVLEIALRELCIEKGIFTAEEHRLSPSSPSRSVQRPLPAWWHAPGSNPSSRPWRSPNR